jgi:ureidoacrylate peracid hydrolase
MVDFAVVAARTALVDVDMQNCFVDNAKAGLKTLGRINAVAAACREAGILVIHTAHVLSPDHSNIGLLGEFLPYLKQGLLDRGATSAALHPDLVVDPSDVVLEKPRFGAFYRTGLEEVLRAGGKDTIIISGISTDVCCDTTAREANARDFKVLFLSDGTAVAGPNPEPAQQETLKLIGALFAQVLSIEQLLAKLELGNVKP